MAINACVHGASLSYPCEHCPHARQLQRVMARLRMRRIETLGKPQMRERSVLPEDEREYASLKEELEANSKLVSSQPAELAALQAEFASLNSDENAT